MAFSHIIFHIHHSHHPFILVLDGYVSSWRTRSFSHILHLADQAKSRIDTERALVGLAPIEAWKWEMKRKCHTWPFGYMTSIVGLKS